MRRGRKTRMIFRQALFDTEPDELIASVDGSLPPGGRACGALIVVAHRGDWLGRDQRCLKLVMLRAVPGAIRWNRKEHLIPSHRPAFRAGHLAMLGLNERTFPATRIAPTPGNPVDPSVHFYSTPDLPQV